MSSETPYFDAHIFVCTNRRPPGHPMGSCAAEGGEAVRDYFKNRIEALGLNARIRVNSAGCLGRCDSAPVLVIYPEGVWYTARTEADVDAIIATHLQGGGRVEALLASRSPA